jgi:hypothetical protein
MEVWAQELDESFGAASGDSLGEGFWSLDESAEGFVDGVDGVDRAHAGGVEAEFGGGLRAAKEQFDEDEQFIFADGQYFARVVAELGDAAAQHVGEEDQLLGAETVQCGQHAVLVEVDDRVAIGLLVAAVSEAVKRHGVTRRGVGLLDQHTQDAGFGWGKMKHRL